MRTGRRIVATIEMINGVKPKVSIEDDDFEIVETKEGEICIVYKKSEGY